MQENSLSLDQSRVPLRPVLLVDDCPDAQLLSERALRRAGLLNPIVTLSSGEEAISYLRASCLAAGGRRARRPEILFLDIHMPGCDGFAVLRWVRRRAAFRKLRVVMLTNSDEPRDVESALRLGAVALVVKYPTPAALDKVLPELARRTAARKNPATRKSRRPARRGSLPGRGLA